ncbi:hypothetical protein, partial [Polycladospora coralii]|uniref:hypothetical protein n=1 Tax=Polycladospora coralii TaxID=2771432 RepID=UPI001CD0F216
LETGACKEIEKPAKIDVFLRAHALTLEDCQYPVESIDCMGLFKKNRTFELLKTLMTNGKRRG